MFDYLFNNKHTELIIFFLINNDACYAQQLSNIFDSSIYGFQKTLNKLERGGLLVSFLEGKTRFYQFNPRYPFVTDIKKIFNKAFSFLPPEIQKKFILDQRKRPRRQGKHIA